MENNNDLYKVFDNTDQIKKAKGRIYFIIINDGREIAQLVEVCHS